MAAGWIVISEVFFFLASSAFCISALTLLKHFVQRRIVLRTPPKVTFELCKLTCQTARFLVPLIAQPPPYWWAPDFCITDFFPQIAQTLIINLLEYTIQAGRKTIKIC